MPRPLTCEADLNFPIPDVNAVAARIAELQQKQVTATTQVVAQSFHLSANALQPVLDRGHRNGVFAFHSGQGWVCLQR